MNQDNLKTVLITGATEGIGWGFSKIFAKDGFDVVLVAREVSKLEKRANELTALNPQIKVEYFSVDLAQLGSADELYNQVKGKNIDVDVLVNNAGVGEHGLFVENPIKKEMDVINLSVVSLVQLTKLFLKDMLIRNRGKILQLSSMLGMIPTPKFAVYAASKAFVLSFTEALQQEIKDTNVTMTVLLPGSTDTQFFERANAEQTLLHKFSPLQDPEEVAQAGYEGLMAGKNRVIPGAMTKLQAASTNLVPNSLLAAAMSKLMEETK